VASRIGKTRRGGLSSARIQASLLPLKCRGIPGGPARLAFALNTTKTLYKELIKENHAYATLCSKPSGIEIDELALYCFCSKEGASTIYVHGNKDLQKRLEKFKNCDCCGDGRQFNVDLKGGSTDRGMRI
jgi:hypothetical protein